MTTFLEIDEIGCDCFFSATFRPKFLMSIFNGYSDPIIISASFKMCEKARTHYIVKLKVPLSSGVIMYQNVNF